MSQAPTGLVIVSGYVPVGVLRLVETCRVEFAGEGGNVTIVGLKVQVARVEDMKETVFSFEWAANFIDRRYPDDIEHPDSACTASAKLLLFAAVEGTIDPIRLASRTAYPIEFILAIAWNMRNNKLWALDGYNSSRWLSSSGGLLPECGPPAPTSYPSILLPVELVLFPDTNLRSTGDNIWSPEFRCGVKVQVFVFDQLGISINNPR